MKTQKGFSLIELMVVIGIMSIAVLGLMTMMDNQNKDMRFMAEKFEMRDTKSILTGVLDEHAYCGCLLNGKTFNTSTGQINQPITSVPINFTTPLPTCTASAQAVIPTAGSKLSGSSNLVVASINFLTATETSPGSGKWGSNLEVTLSNVSRSVRPITVPFFFRINNTAGTAAARPVTDCVSASAVVEDPPVQGFCTPMGMWDNSNSLSCPARTGFLATKLTGVYGSGTWRGSGCCYIPDTAGGNGWCGPEYPSWGGAFSGCGAGNSFYTPMHMRGIQSGTYDQSLCCFIPTNKPKYPVTFGSASLNAWTSNQGCGGPFTEFHVQKQQTVTGGSGNYFSCSYIPKY